MRKLTLVVLLAVLLLAFAVVPAFAIMDPKVPANECSGNSVGGSAGGKGITTNKGEGASGIVAPVHDTNENVPGECPPPEE